MTAAISARQFPCLCPNGLPELVLTNVTPHDIGDDLAKLLQDNNLQANPGRQRLGFCPADF